MTDWIADQLMRVIAKVWRMPEERGEEGGETRERLIERKLELSQNAICYAVLQTNKFTSPFPEGQLCSNS